MSSTTPYKVVTVHGDQEAYRIITKEYWKWLHKPDCDMKYDKVVRVRNERRHVTFMRDDSIGDPRRPGVEPGGEPNMQEIRGPVGTDAFFPVYVVHICYGDPHPGGGKCGDEGRCKEAAEHDLSKIKTDEHGNKKIYAKVSVNGNDPVDITPKSDDHTITPFKFKMRVGDENRLNREPEYRLRPGQEYDGVAAGTYMYLRNFKKGEYVLSFGGEASNFETHSQYTMHVG